MSEELIKRLRDMAALLRGEKSEVTMGLLDKAADELERLLSRPAPAVQVPEEWRDMVKRMERELQACQAAIHLAGGFDPAYVKDAQAVLKDARAMLAAAPAPATVATEAVAQECDCGPMEYCDICAPVREKAVAQCYWQATDGGPNPNYQPDADEPVAQGGGVDALLQLLSDARYDIETGKTAGALSFIAEAEHEIRALLASPAPVGGWMPIETAPKSPYGGCLVYNDKGISQVYWDPEENWWYMSDGKNDYPLRGNEPTNWQPLPAAPAIATQEGE